MNPSEDPADRLVDSLLREQHRNAADEALLAAIEAALDSAAPAAPAAKRPAGRATVRFAIAAGIALTAGAGIWWQSIGRKSSAHQVAMANESRNVPETSEREKAALSLQALNQAIRDQEEKVEERRKVLATIVRTRGITYDGTDSFFGQSGVDGDQGAKNALQTFHKLEQEKMQIESQISSLLNYDGDQLMTYASGLNLPDNIVRDLYPQYLEAKSELEKLKTNGLADNHPTVRATAGMTEAMKRQLDEGVVTLRATLNAQMELASNRLKSVTVMKDETRPSAIRRGLDAQDYIDAKRDFETDQQRLQAMKLKQIELGSVAGYDSSIGARENANPSADLAKNESAAAKNPKPTPPSSPPSSVDAKPVSTLAANKADPSKHIVGFTGYLEETNQPSEPGHDASLPPVATLDQSVARRALPGPSGPSADGDEFGSVGGGGFGRGAQAPDSTTEGLAKLEKTKATDYAFRTEGKMPAGGFVLPGDEPRPGHKPADTGLSREQYGRLTDQPWKSPWNEALSTFSIDVDGASYTNVRNMISQGRPVPPDSVRIEECVNYFDYQYAGPQGESPFAVHGTLATCPWKAGHLLARVAIKGREMDNKARPASNLVFLIDVSGSMHDPQKLPLLKRSMRVLLDQLDERDRLGIVVYAGSEGVVLPPTTLDERGMSKAVSALEKLEAGGSTNGGAGLKRAYAMASEHLVEGGVNRVILATDGDFNVGVTGQGELVSLVKAEAAKGVSLTVTGFGTGNLNDAMMDAITNEGNGNYYYIDGDAEAKHVFQQKLTGTLVTIAKDVKIQVEFNPGKVKAYRLIGYSNRILRKEDFSNDKVDAGDIGAGHTVTAFYEIVPQGVDAPATGEVDGLRYQRPAGREVVPSDEWFTLKLRHKHPEGNVSSLTETTVKGEPAAWENAGNDFRFASAVALFGMKLRQMPETADLPWSAIEEIAKPALTEDPQEQRAMFIEMIRKLSR